MSKLDRFWIELILRSIHSKAYRNCDRGGFQSIPKTFNLKTRSCLSPAARLIESNQMGLVSSLNRPALGVQGTLRSDNSHALMKKNIPESSSLANFIDGVFPLIERHGEKEYMASECLDELLFEMDTCPRTGAILRREAKRHRISPAAAKMLVNKFNIKSSISSKSVENAPGHICSGNRTHPRSS